MSSLDGLHNMVVVKITVKDRDDLSTKDYYFGNRSYDSLDAPYDIQPILMSISGFDARIAQTLPERRSGSITLANTRGSLTRDKKFFDLTVRNAIELQPIEILVWQGEEGEIPSAFETEFKGIITGLSQNENGTCTVTFTSELEFCGFEPFRINRDDFPSAPDRSLGKYLPWIFGSAQVPAYALQLQTATENLVFGYASVINGTVSIDNTSASAQGPAKVYVQDRDNQFIECDPGTSGVYAKWTETNTSGSYTDIALHTNGREFASIMPFDVTDSLGIVLTQVTVTFFGNNVGSTVSGTTILKVYERDLSTGAPSREVAKGRVVNTDYTSEIQANAEFDITFAMEKPAILVGQVNGFAVGISVVVEDNTTDIGPLMRITGTTTLPDFYRNNSTGSNVGNEWLVPIYTPGDIRHFVFNGAVFDFSGSALAARFGLLQATAPTNQENPDLSTLNIIVDSNGITDDVGTFTGTVDALIEDAVSVTAFLLKDCADSVTDTPFSASSVLATYQRETEGASSGRQLPRQILSEVCFNAQCKVTVRRAGGYALWAYGTEQTATTYLTEQDVRLISITRGSFDEVVNNARVAYNEKLTAGELADVQSDQPKTMGSVSEYSWNSGPGASEVAKKSYDLYGNRPLSDTFTSLRYIREDNTAAAFGDAILRQNPYPRLYATIELPYWRADYRTIELMDVLDVAHIDSPSFSGTATSDRVRAPTLEGETVGSFFDDYTFLWRYAQRYLFRVVEKRVDWKLQQGGNATLTLKCLILDNTDEVS